MNLGIVGSRKLEGSLPAYRLIHECILSLEPDKVVSGGAKGIDNMAMEVALAMDYDEDDLLIHLPKPRTQARWDVVASYFARNTLIVEDSDTLLAIMNTGGTSGTMDTVTKAKAKPIPTFIQYVD